MADQLSRSPNSFTSFRNCFSSSAVQRGAAASGLLVGAGGGACGTAAAGAERWRARVSGDVADGMLEAGSRARVLALRGLTLIVEPIESSPS